MTQHLYFDHKCASCEAHYIPFDQIPCPKCGTIEEERQDSAIKSIASAARYHKNSVWTAGQDQYTPIAWATMTFGDHIGYQVFQALDTYGDEENIRSACEENLVKHPEEDAWYFRHLVDVIVKVKEELDNIPV